MRLNLRRNQRKQFCFCSFSVHPMSHRESVTLTYFVYFVPLSLIRPRCIKSWLETTQTVTIMNECEGLTLSNPAGLNWILWQKTICLMFILFVFWQSPFVIVSPSPFPAVAILASPQLWTISGYISREW